MFLDRIPVKLRLSLVHALWMGVLFCGIGFGLYEIVESNLYKSVDAALLTSARAIRDARTIKGFGSPLLQSFLDDFLGEKSIRPYAQLVDLSGKVSAKTPNVRVSLPVTPKAVSRAEAGLETYETFTRKDKASIRQITYPVIVRGQFTGELIQVGAPLDATVLTLRGISWVLWIVLPSGLILSILFGYLLTARSLKPVCDLSSAASRLGINDLGTRLPLPRANDELRTLAKTFNEMLDRLEDAFKRLRRFTGDVSHELRTPISVVRGEAELALRKERTPAEYKQALQTISAEANQMTNIVEDLLLLARAQSRNMALRLESIEAERFALDIKNAVNKIFEGRSVSLRIEQGGPKEFSASPNYLQLAITNLLANAAKHSPKGGEVVLNISMNHDPECPALLFAVKDHGEGIPEKDLPYIFDLFYRADTARNRDVGGVGIGLSLAKALVELHHGQLHVESKPGQGATFTICLPFKLKALKDIAAKPGALERSLRFLNLKSQPTE